MASFKDILHRVVAHPWIYDKVQLLCGAPFTYSRIHKLIATPSSNMVFVDIGGGTGLFHRKIIPQSRYICLDNDTVKLQGFREQEPDGWGLLATGHQLPIKSKSVDWTVIMAVSHHIPEEFLSNVIGESMRILNDDGRLFFLDAVWAPYWPSGRLLWKYDRGSFPREAKILRDILGQHGTILHEESYTIYHKYIICVVAPVREKSM